MALLIKNIRELFGTVEMPSGTKRGKEMGVVDSVRNAFLFAGNDRITSFGRMEDLPDRLKTGLSDPEIIDASGRFVFPSFCDSHTHLVYSGSREQEFADKIRGLSYGEIARRGGGILNSAKKVHAVTEEELYRESMVRINEIAGMGTGAVEIKSGYGLNTADELKMLRVIRRIRENCPLEIRSTFLGAHAVPEIYRNDRESYVDLIINEMIPLVASEGLADYVDVFCDDGFFTVAETERILMAGMKYGLIPKIHANEIGFSGGVQVGVKYNALSVDHLERSGEDEISALLGSETMPTLLPGSAFFLRLPGPPARFMIDSDLPVALASDYNPGSSPSGNMKLVMSLGCIRLKMTPEEVFNAVTVNTAYAMGLQDTHGSISAGKTASLIITKEIPSFGYFPYAFGSNLIDKVILRGKVWNPAGETLAL
ncbi:MAG: imidazolonepropionase [Bacteroidales bacterium]